MNARSKKILKLLKNESESNVLPKTPVEPTSPVKSCNASIQSKLQTETSSIKRNFNAMFWDTYYVSLEEITAAENSSFAYQNLYNDSIIQNVDFSKFTEAFSTKEHLNPSQAEQTNQISDDFIQTASINLICNETMLPSTSFDQSLMENSDDSMKDKDYVPDSSSTSSGLDDVHFSNSLHIIQDDNITKDPSAILPTVQKKKTCKKLKNGLKYEKNLNKYPLREPCHNLCIKLCSVTFSEEARKNIHKHYWSLDWEHQGIFIKNLVTEQTCKKSTRNSKRPRNITYKYHLNIGEKIYEVCKVFFLGTLGYDKKNDRRVLAVMKKSILEQNDKRDGRNLTNSHAIDRTLITAHIESFNPCVHHYRRVHAPNKRYLPSDLTINDMYQNFKDTYSDFKCSLETYRDHLSNNMNISFAKLGHEQCETCETFNLHNPDHVKDTCSECEICNTYAQHKTKYLQAREMYDADSKTNRQPKTVIVSVDLQKVIMLPRIDTFKAALFCPRLVTYNETFVPLGNFKKGQVFAAVWHEGISGRKQEDIASTFRAFFLSQRDAEHIILWLDNCSAQNKNWCFFTFLVSMVNSLDISATTIELKYFEPGHTFMSADSFHHFVEQSMNKKGKIYDIKDFVDAVENSVKSGKVEVKSMEIKDFFNYKSHVSQKKNKDGDGNRVYIKNIVQFMAKRGSYCFYLKKNFHDIEYTELSCFKSKNLPNFTSKTIPKGIDIERKNKIINVLGPLIPPSRLIFWKNLSINSTPQVPEDNIQFDVDE